MVGRLYSLTILLGVLMLITFSLWTVCINIGGPEKSHGAVVEHQILTMENISSKPFNLHTLSNYDLHSLIDLPKFNFIINQNVCESNTQLVMALVHTATSNYVKRQAIRETWAKMIPTLFFMGLPDSNFTQNNIFLENQLYNDIVQGDFIDCYRNLTYKHVMVLKWTLYYCSGARYLLKTDDDVFINAPYLLEILEHRISPLRPRDLIMCELDQTKIVQRSYLSKWSVSYTEYPNRWYPIFCKGWVVIYTQDVIYKLYTEAQVTPYFWIDDVHITGIIAVKQNITQTDLGKLKVYQHKIMNDKNINKFVFILLTKEKPDKSMKKYWNIIRNQTMTV